MTLTSTDRPEWQLPTGVPRGAWEYTQSPYIAGEYDECFAENKLFEFDIQVLLTHFRRPGLVVDLGAGTGRAVVALARHGFPCLAVDLSPHMLGIIRRKAEAENLPIQGVQANLVDLGCIRDGAADYAMCLFSTIGMIRGYNFRQKVLEHARRIVKPGGLFVVHVHNYWFNLYDPLGRAWMRKHWIERMKNREIECGDKFFPFHDIAQMYLHTFTQRELKKALRQAGFHFRRWIPLGVDRQRPLACPWFFGGFRANGWIVVCE